VLINKSVTPKSWLSGLPLLLRVVLAGAPKGSVYDQLARNEPLSSAGHRARRFPVLYALWRELYTLPRRILDQHEKGLFFEGLAIQKIAPECHPRDTRYKARIQGIQNLRELRSWVTLWDELLYLEGLADGWEQGIHMGRLERESALSCSLSKGGNSMPPQAIQQHSKHDRPASLPSQE